MKIFYIFFVGQQDRENNKISVGKITHFCLYTNVLEIVFKIDAGWKHKQKKKPRCPFYFLQGVEQAHMLLRQPENRIAVAVQLNVYSFIIGKNPTIVYNFLEIYNKPK